MRAPRLLQLALIVSALAGSARPAGAANLDSYRQERDRLERRHQALRKRLADLQQAYQGKVAEKQAIVARARDAITSKATARGKELQLELSELKSEFWAVRSFTLTYLERQAEVNERFARVVTSHRLSRENEAATRAAIVSALEAGRASKTIEALSASRQALEELLLAERSDSSKVVAEAASLRTALRRAHATYQVDVAAHAAFLAKFGLSTLEAPSQALTDLENARSYADVRYAELSERIVGALTELSRHADDLFLASGLRHRDEQERLANREVAKRDFVARAGALVAARDQARLSRRLRPEYDAQLAILAHKDTCADLSALRASDSIEFSGCALLQGAVADATHYLEARGWTRLGIALLAFSSAPAELLPKVEVLRAVRRAMGSDGTSLGSALRRHDALLEELELIRGGGER